MVYEHHYERIMTAVRSRLEFLEPGNEGFRDRNLLILILLRPPHIDDLLNLIANLHVSPFMIVIKKMII